MLEDHASRAVAAALAAVVLVGLGFVIGRYGTDAPSDPALALAREYGLALPEEQEAAFFDGVISAEERQEAAARWEACVHDGGVRSFVVTLDRDGHGASSGSPTDAALIVACRIRHFEATEWVWGLQD